MWILTHHKREDAERTLLNVDTGVEIRLAQHPNLWTIKYIVVGREPKMIGEYEYSQDAFSAFEQITKKLDALDANPNRQIEP